MAVVLEVIHRALATQIANHLARDTNVYPFPVDLPVIPAISVHPASGTYIDYFSTFGPNGTSDLKLRLKLEVDSDAESVAIQICDYLSVGTDNNSSIVDAVHFDRTLGGAVDDTAVLTAEWDVESSVVWIDVWILLTKQNAEV